MTDLRFSTAPTAFLFEEDLDVEGGEPVGVFANVASFPSLPTSLRHQQPLEFL